MFYNQFVGFGFEFSVNIVFVYDFIEIYVKLRVWIYCVIEFVIIKDLNVNLLFEENKFLIFFSKNGCVKRFFIMKKVCTFCWLSETYQNLLYYK